MKRLCYLGLWKEGFSPYSNPVMLISRKLAKGKRVVTDFKHLNVRRAKNNLAYPLMKDAFSVLGSSKCEVLSNSRFKRCIPLIMTVRKFQEILQVYSLILVAHHIYTEDAYGIKHIPLHMAILYQCNSRLSSKQEILWSNHGWSSIVYTSKVLIWQN